MEYLESITPEILKTIIDEKGRPWVVAAMVDGSIGYHTPKHAEILIDRFLSGKEKDYCERCDACFKSDLIEVNVPAMNREA